MSSIHNVRNDKLSVFQSMVDDFLHRTEGKSANSEGATRPTLDHPYVRAAAVYAEHVHATGQAPDVPPPEVATKSAGETAWECVKLAGDLFLAKIEHRQDRVQQLEDELRMSTCDPRWIEAIDDYVKYFGVDGKKGKIPYITYQQMDDFVLETLPPNATVALLGDWGTGTADARNTLEQVARKKPDVLIHLGDIYYAGTAKETGENFLDLINEVLDRDNNPIPVYTMTGNHDMYSGGAGYYDLLPKLNPSPPFDPAQAQPASFCCLRTQDGSWQFQIMDTGLHDHDPFDVSTDVTYLEPSEAEWHLDKIERWHQAGGKTVLLSHHQLFSASDYIGKGATKPPGQEAFNPKLLETFQQVLQQRKVAAWFWGHQHNLCIYQPYPPLNKGRCIGHGAIPVFESSGAYEVSPSIPAPPQLVTDPATGEPLHLPLDDDGVYRHGYVILELDDDAKTATASYYIETDENVPIYREEL